MLSFSDRTVDYHRHFSQNRQSVGRIRTGYLENVNEIFCWNGPVLDDDDDDDGKNNNSQIYAKHIVTSL
jgi:hypothetical protein